MTAIGNNDFLDKDRFTIQIGDTPIQQGIKFLETKMASCCGVKRMFLLVIEKYRSM